MSSLVVPAYWRVATLTAPFRETGISLGPGGLSETDPEEHASRISDPGPVCTLARKAPRIPTGVHKRRIFNDPGHAHELTFAVYRHTNLFQRRARARVQMGRRVALWVTSWWGGMGETGSLVPAFYN